VTAIRVVRLWCDHRDEPAEGSQYGHGCNKEFEPPAELGFIKSMPGMRRLAAKCGWTHVPYPDRSLRGVLDKDFCPEHSDREHGDAS
jgi:hypothetical protein